MKHRSSNAPSRSNGAAADNFLFLLPLGAIFAGWEAAARLNLFFVKFAPSPSEILAVLFTNLGNPEFVYLILHSMANLVLGIIIASVFAIPLAIGTGLKSRVDSTLTPLVMIVGALPDLALLPLIVFWFGPGMAAAVFMATVVAFFPVFFTVREGVKDIPQDYFHVAEIYKAKKYQVYTKLVFPAVLPQIVTGVRLAYEFLWEIVLAIEIIASIHGIGFFINHSVQAESLTQAFAGIFAIGGLAIIIDRTVFQRLENYIRKWHE
ncbi:ABC transporter permease [Candidatus Hecatella orcuttiae]|jgi:sulfonate transport system permease protein|uniref:ABC transporter permease n=1 Tax=Candidatus Hecatella orcuttiae TaxID=1935119 RepID=UPI002867C8BC|nr:ABC transporter permease subunit [Candidatus Hecatella orcuttiae]